MWAPAVAFFVMVPLVLSRRSIYRMRGARVAVGFLAAVALTDGRRPARLHAGIVAAPPVALQWALRPLRDGRAGAARAARVAPRFGGRAGTISRPGGAPKGDEILH